MTLPRNARKDAASIVPRADRLMKKRLFAEAIALYEERVAAVPADLASLLKLGICHLLNRSEKRFLKIYLQGKERMASLSDLPAGTAALWRKYEDLAFKVAGGALVIGSLAIGGSTSAIAGNADVPTGTPPGVATPAPTDPGTCNCTNLRSTAARPGDAHDEVRRRRVPPADPDRTAAGAHHGRPASRLPQIRRRRVPG